MEQIDDRAFRRREWLRALRIVVTVFATLGAFGAVTYGSDLAVRLLGLDSDSGNLTVEQTFGTDGFWGVAVGLATLTLLGLLAGQLARRVDYRWFDGLAFLLPPLGIFWFARWSWRAAYRISADPVRDWPPASVRAEGLFDRAVARLRRRTVAT